MTGGGGLLYDWVAQTDVGPWMPVSQPKNDNEMPHSLEGHDIPEARLGVILPLVAELSKTALAVSRGLPFQADAADFVRTLEAEKD